MSVTTLTQTRIDSYPVLRFVSSALLGSMLLALASQIAVPLPWTTVPFTMQTLALFFLGTVLAPKCALTAVLFYLAEGALGLPVFSMGHGGYICLLGLDGGWLLSFAPAIWLMSYLYRNLPWSRTVSTLTACVVADLIIFCIGLTWTTLLSGGQTTLALTALPLLLTDFAKIALFTTAIPLAKKVQL